MIKFGGYFPWKGLAIGFIIGFGITRSFFGAFLLAGLGAAIELNFSGRMATAKGPGKVGFLGREETFISSIMALSSIIVNQDNRLGVHEKRFIQQHLIKDFGPERGIKYYGKFEDYLKKRLDLNKICDYVVENYDQSGKIQLIHFLCGLATADAFLGVKELQMLRTITSKIGLPSQTLDSLLSMFNFTTEAERKQKEQRRQQRSTPTTSSLSRAYSILGIAASASDNEVKKAYRKLAKVHHPDKVIHLGEEFQKKAKEKFQIIQDAYELIRANRGIV